MAKREFRLKFLNATVKFIPEVVGGKKSIPIDWG